MAYIVGERVQFGDHNGEQCTISGVIIRWFTTLRVKVVERYLRIRISQASWVVASHLKI